MSREFGSYAAGYFHTQMAYAAEDLASGRSDIARAWARFFDEFQHVAYSIASCEACDSGEYDPIMESIRRMAALQKALDEVKDYLAPFEDVMREAVRARSNQT